LNPAVGVTSRRRNASPEASSIAKMIFSSRLGRPCSKIRDAPGPGGLRHPEVHLHQLIALLGLKKDISSCELIRLARG
jgi:hypothetical protein